MYIDDPSKKYVLLDIEGNAASKESERRITQFSAMVFHDGKIEEISWYNRNVNSISPYVVRLTKISVNKCKVDGLSERHLINNIYELLKSCDMIYAYGCDFDKSIIKIMFKKYGLEPLNTTWYDIINDVKKYLDPTKSQLSVASSEYGFKENEYHNALVDCHATYFLMKTIEDIRRISQ